MSPKKKDSPDKSIEKYRDKRDFERTPEPPPAMLGRDGPPVYVVHRHEARRLHYDLRVEMDGVLRSWAIPKGFSFDPSVKHLAVRTEDHPIEYEDFEGLIPPGEYGAGAMTLWDKGTYELIKAPDGATAVASGEVKLRLFGRRLRGEFHLVKTNQGKDSWLIFKSKDVFAGPARDSVLGFHPEEAPEKALPARLTPMRAKVEEAPFTDTGWLFEAELMGKRLVAERKGDAVRLRGLSHTPPEVERALLRLRAETALLDGVLVASDELGRPSEERLQAILAGELEGELAYYAFDLMHWEGLDLRGYPTRDRKAALRAIVPEGGAVLFVDHVLGEGEHLSEAVAAAGLRAVIAKKADAPYRAGKQAAWKRLPVDAAPVEEDVAVALEKAAPKRAPRRVKVSNLEKVFWPAEGLTKGDLIAYYEQVAEVLLPHIQDRPIHLNRYPDGIEGKNFYQRHPPAHLPSWIPTADIPDSGGDMERYVVCNDRDTLLYLVNSGSIDLHPWMSRVDTNHSPDWTILDLDAKQSTFADVVRVARQAGRILRGIGMRPLLKTSGKTGLHVVVPLREGYGYEQSRMFCEAVARVVAHELPDIATVERIPSKRGTKVYVDFGQNGRGQTVVPPYVARPVPGASVSAPLDWDELDLDLSPQAFTLRTLPERLAELGDLFHDALTDRQDLEPAIERLEDYLRQS